MRAALEDGGWWSIDGSGWRASSVDLERIELGERVCEWIALGRVVAELGHGVCVSRRAGASRGAYCRRAKGHDMRRLRDICDRARCWLGLDSGAIDWGPAGDDDGMTESAELWAELMRFERGRR